MNYVLNKKRLNYVIIWYLSNDFNKQSLSTCDIAFLVKGSLLLLTIFIGKPCCQNIVELVFDADVELVATTIQNITMVRTRYS